MLKDHTSLPPPPSMESIDAMDRDAATLPPEHLEWDKLSIEQKIERNRQITKSMMEDLAKCSQLLGRVNLIATEHRHAEDGLVMISYFNVPLPPDFTRNERMGNYF